MKGLGSGPRCDTNFDIFQSQEMTACVRGGQNKCSIDYSVAGGTSPDTFEIAATTGTDTHFLLNSKHTHDMPKVITC